MSQIIPMTIKPTLGQIWKATVVPSLDLGWEDLTYQEIENMTKI